jgi:hypothetical protein
MDITHDCVNNMHAKAAPDQDVLLVCVGKQKHACSKVKTGTDSTPSGQGIKCGTQMIDSGKHGMTSSL